MRRIAACVVVGLWATASVAEPIFPQGSFPDLDEQFRRHGRQFYLFNARPFGLSLDTHYVDAEARSLISQFLDQDVTDDVEAVTGKHPYELLGGYGEFGDLGFFGGVAVAGTAYQYLALKQEGAPAAALEQARAQVVRAAESWHVFYVVTGGNGVVARGIRRLVPEDPDDPPLPGTLPEITELFDADGNPLPEPKNNGTVRPDNSGGVLPEGVWIWTDSCSKDQLIGQIFGMVALYDAMKDDPDIDQSLVTRMEEDARLVGEMLMEPRDISQLPVANGEGVYDLIIMDADGRPTFYHDLNPKSLEKWYFPETSGQFNRFNVIMALGAIKGLLHVSGDPALEDFLYQDLMGERELLDLLFRDEGAIDYIWIGQMTNWDNPDMTALALWLSIYLENDPDVLTPLRRFLEESWWATPGEHYTAQNSKQPLWSMVYMTLTDQGVDPGLIDETRDLLEGFSLGPYYNDERINCDEDELAAGECLAIDGTTVLTLVGKGERDGIMAEEALHPSIRPPSNFNSRSNPHAVNGGGGQRINPGGDLLAAYWIGRYMQASAAGESNRSPFVRDHLPLGGVEVVDESGGGGCGCAVPGSRGLGGLAALLGLALLAVGRRRARHQRPR